MKCYHQLQKEIEKTKKKDIREMNEIEKAAQTTTPVQNFENQDFSENISNKVTGTILENDEIIKNNQNNLSIISRDDD